MFGQSVLDSIYTANGVQFKVTKIDPYPRSRISDRYREILYFPPGVLVAIPYRGTLIPNITLSKGVVRLLEVEVDGELYDNPKAISQTLKVEEAMYSYDLTKS